MARGLKADDSVDELRCLLQSTLDTEAQLDYGPPRIFYPELLEEEARVLSADFVQPASGGDQKMMQKSITHEAQWGPLGSTSGEWISDPDQLSSLAPVLTEKVCKDWFKADWEPHSYAGRNIEKGFANLVNRVHILQYMTVTEDTALFRMEVSHSMISGNAASNHSGKLRAAIRVETAEHKNGYRKVTKVLDAECRCKASESGKCHHVCGTCLAIIFLWRSEYAKAPMSSTEDANTWRKASHRLNPVADKFLPISRLAVQQNRFGNSKPKKRRRSAREGDGGRFA